ncbi:NPCBM/NEW2 domain-containing protein [Emticicia sp. BO119]|uniref:NPCBM/NEW2 domain-containing protein n=1 Tax=Emticicia sp. BO119 TaxID=2757768 RepID=UPI0015F0FCC4|nr:NPCBM/NEW2 domain-containing protein [Emticicia sp. BO119]MBA4850180.1 NPCBM/NEW2 domain-containing protein [Emticicia sp. BO119]
MKLNKHLTTIFITLSLTASAQNIRAVWLDDLLIQTYSEGIRPVQTKKNYSGDTLRMNGKKFERGLGAQSPCVLAFLLNNKARHFSASIGADDLGNKNIPLNFYVLGDGKVLFEKTGMRIGDEPVKVEVDLKGIKQLGLLVTDNVGGVNNKRTYCNWIDAQIEMTGDYIPEHVINSGEKYILTPQPASKPKINSARLFGATPDNPFLYTIAATGQKPMSFSASKLPKGLNLDSQTGIITGSIHEKGTYKTILKARNRLGEATKELTIRIGDTIALTPPIGWNGWNSWEAKIDREKVIASAEAMVKTGLKDHGWTYINIDDAWQGKRGGPGYALQPNEKFPDIKGMFDYIHSLGLKTGLYSTPYISSYGGYTGASSDFEKGGETHESIIVNRRAFNRIARYRFEDVDAKQMADWGVDFLKYDWRIDINSAERMQTALKNSGRDIVFSLSNNAPFDKVQDWVRTSNMYRTGPDIKDSWTSLYLTSFSLDKWSPYSGHGHWADPDMMIIGKVSIGPVMHDTRLTPDEQYSHVSMFSILAAPLLIGCPIDQLDEFTLNLLSNDEVIEINQDPLGKGGRLILNENGIEVWQKPLEDGSYAIGLFNTADFGKNPQSYFHWGNEKSKVFTLDLKKIGLTGKYRFRDVWRQKDSGIFTDSFKAEIRHHGVVLLRVFPVKKQ